MTDRFVDPAVAAERFERLQVVVERSALAKHQARIGRIEEVLVEGPSKKDPAVLTGRTRQNKLVHFAAADAVPHRQLRHGRDHRAPRRTTSIGRFVERRRRAAAQAAHRRSLAG